ncbi:YdcF family protein [Telmatospirillum sp.]|uniref:YdcF family protein n=1 Tax=Telmatospirillum sp. TaxID=2079197 RepID=UPI0028411F9E|nr:YdcF family protein [Telmatospirillum sp.]MDR3440050.1 YdcF family protein [Telmatospirillum sp.]
MSADFDVAVILGAAILRTGEPSPALLRRIGAGVSLIHQGRVGHLLLSGGAVRHSNTEASVMHREATAAGVPETSLLIEDQSLTTLDNARFCGPIIRARGWSRLLLVTDGYHLPRALYTFRRFGLPATGWAVPAPPWNLALIAAHIREMAAFCVYPRRIDRVLRTAGR